MDFVLRNIALLVLCAFFIFQIFSLSLENKSFLKMNFHIFHLIHTTEECSFGYKKKKKNDVIY